jgi:hypothetical protein
MDRTSRDHEGAVPLEISIKIPTSRSGKTGWKSAAGRPRPCPLPPPVRERGLRNGFLALMAIGHRPQPVATRRHLQVTDEHFRLANGEAVRNPVRQPAKSMCDGLQAKTGTIEKRPETQVFSEDCRNLQEVEVGDGGLEPSTSRV